MMRRLLPLLIFSALAAAPAFAQGGANKTSPYAGEERREIKSLAPEEIQALLNGEGMAQAKAAELNHYPGPKHVLELADKLKLTPKQKEDAQEIYKHMHSNATRLGTLIIDAERELERLFASGEVDHEKLWGATRNIGKLRGELRMTHLSAHLTMKAALTPEQLKRYDELRGYNAPGERQHHRKH